MGDAAEEITAADTITATTINVLNMMMLMNEIFKDTLRFLYAFLSDSLFTVLMHKMNSDVTGIYMMNNESIHPIRPITYYLGTYNLCRDF